MANISTYSLDTEINGNDKVIGTDGTIGPDAGATKNFTVSALAAFISQGTGLLTADVTLTDTQLKSLNGGSTHIELIEKPAVGKIIVPLSVAGFLDYNTTQYNFSGYLFFGNGNYENRQMFVNHSALNKSQDHYFLAAWKTNDLNTVVDSATVLTDKGFHIRLATGATVTTGDSPVRLIITYRIIDFT